MVSPVSHYHMHSEYVRWRQNLNNESWKQMPPWQPIDIPSTKLASGDPKIRKVLEELDPGNAPRYKRTANGTTCNIFVWDYTRAMGCEIPHWVTSTGDAAPVGKGRELNANGIVRWLAKHGPPRGWIEADRQTAMDAAARGHTVVVGWDSQSSAPGHVAILLPEGTIAQTGAKNFIGRSIREGFGTRAVVFYIYAPGTHNAQT